jgi:SulP family sulfate permease
VPAAILALLAGIGTYLVLCLFDATLLTTTGNPLLVGPLSGNESSLGDTIGQHVLALSGFGPEIIPQVFAPALTLGVLLSIDTMKTCLVTDAMTNTHHDSNRELIGQGLGNLGSALIGGIPGAGTMGATMINITSGGTTKLSGVMEGVFALLAFLLLAPLIAWVPIAALSAILIVIGFRMIDTHSLGFFFSPTTRIDFFVILAVIPVAIFGNLIAASGVGVALAIMLFIREQTRSTVVRHRIEGNEILTKRARTPEDIDHLEREGSNMVVFELQGSLFFGTANQLLTALEPETSVRKCIILNMRRVQSLDVTATHVLEQIKDRLEEHNAYLVFCDIPKGLPSGLKMKRFLKETGVVRPTNKAFAFRELDDVLEWLEAMEIAGVRSWPEDTALELRDMPLLIGCAREAVAALEAAVELHTIKAGKRIIKAGTDCNELFIIRSGTVKISVPLRKKASYHLATCGPGDLIGDMGFIESGSHAVDATAVTDCQVYMITREQFEFLSVMHEDLLLAIFGTITRTLSTRLHLTIAELQALRD